MSIGFLLASGQSDLQADVEHGDDAAGDEAENEGEHSHQVGRNIGVGGDAGANAAQDVVLFGLNAEFVGRDQHESEDDEEDNGHFCRQLRVD